MKGIVCWNPSWKLLVGVLFIVLWCVFLMHAITPKLISRFQSPEWGQRRDMVNNPGAIGESGVDKTGAIGESGVDKTGAIGESGVDKTGAIGESGVDKTGAIGESGVDKTGAIAYLEKYQKAFSGKDGESNISVVPADPNKPETITRWWQAAAMMNWYMKADVRYKCKKRVRFGNKGICQDNYFKVKPPCLVYSFGINFDFSFDDAMGKLGCEVHSFDPSMKLNSYKRNKNVTFHNLGLSHENTDTFEARRDIYVKQKQRWKTRTVKRIMKDLGHGNRIIDVLKMDIERYEWTVLDNMIETGVFKYIRQMIVEYHIFRKFPLKEDFLNLYKTFTELRTMGLHEFFMHCHLETMHKELFGLQADAEYVNMVFRRERGMRTG